MAERGNRDAVDAGSVEDRRPGRDRNLLAVDGQLNFGRQAWNSCCPSHREQTPAGQRVLARALPPPRENASAPMGWARARSGPGRRSKSASSRPRARRAVASRNSKRGLPVHPVSMSTIFCEPTRQGTHLPQDSLRKKRTAFSAMSSMQRPSAQTTIAPEPTIEPAAASASSRAEDRPWSGQISGRRPRGREAQQRAAVENAAGVVLKISSEYLRAHRDFKNSGPVHIAADADKLHARRDPFLPCALNQSTPCTRICGGEGERLDVVDRGRLVPQAFVPGKGGLLRGSARLPSMASSSALSSPQM